MSAPEFESDGEGYPDESWLESFEAYKFDWQEAKGWLLNQFPNICEQISCCQCKIEDGEDFGPAKVITFTTGGWSGAAFEAKVQFNTDGNEFWSARDLQELFEYAKWENFETALRRAMVACRESGQDIGAHWLPDVRKSISGKGRDFVKAYFSD